FRSFKWQDIMYTHSRNLIALLVLAVGLGVAFCPRSNSLAASTPASLQELVDRAAKMALEKFKDKNLKEENLSITLIDLRDPQNPVRASFRGNERIYPASVVKLFYLARS